MDFKDKTIIDFVNELSSNSPVPGGGGAAALVGSLSAALSNMVFNLSINKKAFTTLKDNEQRSVIDALDVCERKAKEFLDFIDKDGEAFSTLMKAYKMPKDSEEALKVREKTIQEGLKSAMQVPLDLLKNLVAMMSYIDIAATYGNANVISDAGVSAILAYAAIESSVLNVMVNLNFINEINKDEVIKTCTDLLDKSEKLKKEIMLKVYNKI
ncbi:cyclodeaminase/cyclohydrolase family protein [Clostridium manihotivorum]|uniref:Methenyltetrahydrofolate cyclohydrolase n=1 Tax=Clostridium manihotivorum TaxID=2320868 RepID=A0A3R5QTL8_9CLOT|nr:cyclodeaminase/cyclohydrolase family protein [Clostridium manihotivorum]QAA32019.1 methenyltetrahydrofolate cyclohydrolase [Clostridium manihotivorum]